MSCDYSVEINSVSKNFKTFKNNFNKIKYLIKKNNNLIIEDNIIIKNVSLKVKKGESLGILGINGSGKSTLLKLIAGTSVPSSGTISLHGGVSAILELGMGFHPHFTGRQNAINYGFLLGFKKDEMIELMPKIESFAEIGDYIDKPTRIYSSGMLMRLAFSVATVKKPDILIIDEALSVGDSYFQHKSFNRIKKLNELGTSLIIVSHDRWAIQNICDRAILLSKGNIICEGSPSKVSDYYNALISNNNNTNITQTINEGQIKTISGNFKANICSVNLYNERNEVCKVINTGQKITLKIIIKINFDIPELVLGYMIKDSLSQPVYGTNTFHTNNILFGLKKDSSYEFSFTFHANLGEGSYSIAVALHSDYSHIENNYEWQDLAYVFSILNLTSLKFIGTNWMPPEVELIEIN